MRSKTAVLLLSVLILPLLLSSCGASEPEQVYLVSAVGFDGDVEGITLSIEVPMSRAGDSKGMECKLFTGRGTDAEEALRQVTVGLSRELTFEHCALMVLGEGLTAEQSDAVFAFASSGVLLPLAAQVVFTPNARTLLEGGGISSPAAGYDLPAILRETEELLGFRTRAQIYELRANDTPEIPTLLPYFIPTQEKATPAASFGGLALLRRGENHILLDVQSCLPYAILADLFHGTDGSAGSIGGGKLHLKSSSLRGSATEAGITFSLEVFLRADGMSREEREALQAQIECETVTLFGDLRARMSGDVFRFRERVKGLEEMDAGEFVRMLATSELIVACHVLGEEVRM